ncbi:5620_t:CDS:2 [Entrophospora sp. SA101]|nr:5620_t:CDS:2 [Entrophospora sp. SA101]CAJ0824035.1 11006_t:CDS:2 [Entrophospora sp. SA101]
MVGFKNGFLPRQDPLVNLPDKFYALDYILKNMPINLSKNGEKKGLLAKGELGNVVLNDLPLYDVNDINDQRFLSALFRDYTFLASAYLLEPCDIMFREKKDYGLGVLDNGGEPEVPNILVEFPFETDSPVLQERTQRIVEPEYLQLKQQRC